MKSSKILLFFTCVVAMLALCCAAMPANGLAIGNLTLRLPRLQKILHPEKELSAQELMEEENLEANNNQNEELLAYQKWVENSNCRFWFPNDDLHFFDPVFQKMETAKKKGRYVRVMHYGDSQIEMDRISNRLRTQLQKRFGGGGPGMVPLQTIIPTFSISTWSADSLQRYAPFGDSLVMRSHGHYGPMVQCFRVNGSTASTFRATRQTSADSKLKSFQRIGALCSHHPGNVTPRLSVRKPNGVTIPEPISSEHGIVHLTEWRLDTAVSQVQLSFSGSGDIYGILLDGTPGVAVDNIPMRGCSGQQFVQIDSSLLAASYAQLDVALIILQFGGNSVPYIRNEKALNTYCKSIGRQIDRVYHCCPEAKILFIGPSDMSTRVNGETQSYPYLETIIERLRKTANAHGAAYWSIYHAMGGHNSMKAWSRDGLAGSDGVHFSQEGADLMGDKLAESLIKMYEYYGLLKTSLKKTKSEKK